MALLFCGTATSCLEQLITWQYVWILPAIFFAPLPLTILYAAYAQCIKRRTLADDRKDELPFEHTSSRQTGLVITALGSIILHSWVVVFWSSFVFMVVVTLLIIQAGGFQDVRDFGLVVELEYFCMVALVHIIWVVQSVGWKPARTLFMVPAGTLGRPATHVLVHGELETSENKGPLSPSRFRQSMGMKLLSEVFIEESEQNTMLLKVLVEPSGTRTIRYLDQRFVYNPEVDIFEGEHFGGFTLEEAFDSLQNGGLSEADALKSQKEFGWNFTHVHVPGIFQACLLEFNTPSYAATSAAICVYSVFDHEWNSLAWIVVVLSLGLVRTFMVQRPLLQMILSFDTESFPVAVLRGGKWREVDCQSVVVNDIVMVDTKYPHVPVDGLLLQGTVVVQESMLTGESNPLAKASVKRARAQASIANAVYKGTHCIESSGSHHGKAVMICTAVAEATARGQLVQIMLFSRENFITGLVLYDVYGFLVLWVVLLCAFNLLRSAVVPGADGHWIRSIPFITQAVHPMMPTMMVLTQNILAMRLDKQHNIRVMDPSNLVKAGQVSAVVFDKTGTITTADMELEGIIAVTKEGQELMWEEIIFDPLSTGSMNFDLVDQNIPQDLRYALASCHTLVKSANGMISGHLLEKKMVAAVGWSVEPGSVVSPDKKEVLHIEMALEFDHKRMTSGAVVLNRDTNERRVYIKGACSTILSYAKPESVPEAFKDTVEEMEREGNYVLGLAMKRLPITLLPEALERLGRDELEEDLDLLGIMLFRNEIRNDSLQAIDAISRGGIRCVMCTGDNALTGILIAKDCGMIHSADVLLGEIGPSGNLEWRNPMDSTMEASEDMLELNTTADLAVTHQSWKHLLARPEELMKIWERITVFARMTSKDKVSVVAFLQSVGDIVGVVGDGGNDCAALASADVGVSFSDSIASRVADFLIGEETKSLLSVVTIMKFGRACSQTHISTVVYFASWAMACTTTSIMLEIYYEQGFDKTVWTFFDVGLNIVVVAGMMTCGPSEFLSTERLSNHLVTRQLCAKVVLTYFLYIICAALMLVWVHDQHPDHFFNPVEDLRMDSRTLERKGDSHLTGYLTLTLTFFSLCTAYVNTYGNAWRAKVIYNRSIHLAIFSVLLLVLLACWDKPTAISRFLRLNLDSTESTKDDVNLRGVDYSCFFGPQALVWQDELRRDYTSGDPQWLDSFPGGWWLPQAQFECSPPYDLLALDFEDSAANLTSIEDISGDRYPTCQAANNCMNYLDRVALLVAFCVIAVVSHFGAMSLSEFRAKSVAAARERNAEGPQKRRALGLERMNMRMQSTNPGKGVRRSTLTGGPQFSFI